MTAKPNNTPNYCCTTQKNSVKITRDFVSKFTTNWAHHIANNSFQANKLGNRFLTPYTEGMIGIMKTLFSATRPRETRNVKPTATTPQSACFCFKFLNMIAPRLSRSPFPRTLGLAPSRQSLMAGVTFSDSDTALVPTFLNLAPGPDTVVFKL